MSDFVQQNSFICSFNSSDNWTILNPIEQSIKSKIDAVGIPLKNWDIKINFGIKTAIGQDRGVVLAQNKNITDIEIQENWDDVCTKILPYTTDGEVAITLDDPYVELGEDLYTEVYTKVIKFDNELLKVS